jgi:hypothetical protein
MTKELMSITRHYAISIAYRSRCRRIALLLVAFRKPHPAFVGGRGPSVFRASREPEHIARLEHVAWEVSCLRARKSGHAPKVP